MLKLNWKDNKDVLPNSVMKKSLAFFKWSNLSFEEKQEVRRQSVIKMTLFLKTAKILNTRNHEKLLKIYKLNIELCDFLDKIEIVPNSIFELREFFNMFRCFPAKLLSYQEVYDFALRKLRDDSILVSQKKELEFRINQLFKMVYRKMNNSSKSSIFNIQLSTLDFFEIDVSNIQNGLIETGYDYTIDNNEKAVSIIFSRGRRQLPLLKLIKIKNKSNELSNNIFNLGVFEN